ncbi:MAG: ParB N-terminal domain-containing protein [Deltaproteobacteria bacterium]
MPIDRIVGSVGRYNDFDSRFRIKSHMPSERLQQVKAAMRSGKKLPPVKLYQIKDDYYVLDGNHRVAAAKEFGYDRIDATILEFIPSKKTLENYLYIERSKFQQETQLQHDIELTEVGQYDYLLKQIQDHQDYLHRMSGEDVSIQKAARDWYQTIYSPMAAIIEQGDLIGFFPDRSLADLYAYITHHQWELGRKRKYGIGIDKKIPKDMEEFRNKMSELKKNEYPDMQRGITAFVLINVKAKSEFKVIDKLFVHSEVKELHSVHGDVDILAKIDLKRDLLSSDAEIIGQFVYEKIRGVTGVTSTQTLIPGFSKVKDS